MSIICKIIGHARKKGLEILHHNGWSRHWNQSYDHHQFGFTCTRCNKPVIVGIVPTNKEGKVDVEN